MTHAARTLSLRARLELLIAAFFLCGMVILYFAARAYGRDAADRSFDRLLAGSAISITESVSVAGRKIDVDVPYAALDMLSAAPDDRVFYAVTGPDGTITGYEDLPTSDGSGQTVAAKSRNEPERFSFFDAQYRGETIRFARLERQISIEGALGSVHVQIGQSRRARESVAQDTAVSALIPIAVVMVCAMAIVWFGVARALSPLRRIGDEMASRSPDDLRPIDAPVPRELQPFVHAANGLMTRLATSIETLKAFIADASHQMRTPLAAMLAQAQATRASPTEELDRSLEAITRNGARLTHLLNQLLADATVSHRAGVGRFDGVDLIELVRESIRDTAGVIEGSDVRFRAATAPAGIRGDGVVLVEAFKNIIHNAIRHGRPAAVDSDAAPVEVEVTASGDGFAVQVRDRGPGIASADRERVFERFVRLKADAAGAGIGLSIARRAIDVHRGRIELRDRDGGGLIVEIWLPR
jgi:two-component system, OmpR family, sensor histidine kinase TctE